MLEQALQLLIKYFLALKIGCFPRTHSLIRLIEEAGQLEPELVEYLTENRDALMLLEDAL